MDAEGVYSIRTGCRQVMLTVDTYAAPNGAVDALWLLTTGP